jgi:hypothetical protein
MKNADAGAHPIRMGFDPLNPRKMPRDNQYAKGGKVKAAMVRDLDGDGMADGGNVRGSKPAKGAMPIGLMIAIGEKPKRK